MRLLLTIGSLLFAALAASRPLWVVKEFPADGSISAFVEAIGAEGDMTKEENVDPVSLRLIVDGADVTQKSRITMTRDWPPSLFSISYSPTRIKPGTHHADLYLRTTNGEELYYGWTFTITP